MNNDVDRSVDPIEEQPAAPTAPEDLAEHWQSAWTGRAHSETSWYSEQPMRPLGEVVETLDAESSVIDVGGGASLLVDHLLDRGVNDVTVLDIARAALARARKRLGERADLVTWVHADIVTWTPERTYTLWHDRAAFHFLTDPALRRAYVATAAQAVEAGGSLVLSTFAPDGPEQCSGLAVQRWSADDLTAQFADAFEPVASRSSIHETPWGAEQRFTTVVLRRRADPTTG